MCLGIAHCEMCPNMTENPFHEGRLTIVPVQPDIEAPECLNKSSRLVWMDERLDCRLHKQSFAVGKKVITFNQIIFLKVQ